MVMAVSGLRWETVPHLLAVVRSGKADLHQLSALANLSVVITAPDTLRQAQQKSPEDPLVCLGLGAEFMVNCDYPNARESLLKAVKFGSQMWGTHAMLGNCWIETQDWEQLPLWWKNLPEQEQIPVPGV